VNVHPDVALVRPQRLAGVDADANSDRPSGEAALSAGGGGDRVARTGEGDEERISLRVDLGAAVVGESLSKDDPVSV
jgi:hypothetical protein